MKKNTVETKPVTESVINLHDEIEIRINEMLKREAKSENCSVEEFKKILTTEYGKYASRGYGIFNSCDVAVEHIERIDVLNVYDGDLDAGMQAEKDGIKLIPFDLNPKGYPYDCYRFIDTPENRKMLRHIKRNQYFYDENGNEYWYGEDNKKHYTRNEG